MKEMYFKTIANDLEDKRIVKESTRLKKPDKTKIVDDSKFIPMSELIKRNAKQIGTKVFSNSEVQGYFDYPNGYINGKTTKKPMGVDKTQDGKNMAVLSQTIHEEKIKLNETIKNKKEKAEKKLKYQKIYGNNDINKRKNQ